MCSEIILRARSDRWYCSTAMDLGHHEGSAEIPLPAYNHNAVEQESSAKLDHPQHAVTGKKIVRYRECLKNHAATMGGNATDGCGEFMPSGEDGTLEALKCSACDCHRNFHRREVEGEPSCDCFRVRNRSNVLKRSVLSPVRGGQDPFAFNPGGNYVLNARPPSQMIMSFGAESDDQQDEGAHAALLARPAGHAILKKRFRTKFSQEQKDKMLDFADKVGWRIQKHDEMVVQRFCQEIGVKRRVLKVWMHNNKHTLGKKS